MLLGCGGGTQPPVVEDLPPQPVSLDLLEVGPLSATLTWSRNPEPDFAAYRITRLPLDPPADSSLVATIGDPADTVWIDDSIGPHRSYLYRVAVVDLAGQATASHPLEVESPGLPGLAVGFEPRRVFVAPGEWFTLDLWAEGVENLFGAAVEFTFAEGSVDLDSYTWGSLLGRDTLRLLRVDPGRVSLGLTRIRGQDEVSGWGNLQRFLLQATAPGTTSIAIEPRIELQREDGSPVPGLDEIALYPSTIVCTAAPEGRTEGGIPSIPPDLGPTVPPPPVSSSPDRLSSSPPARARGLDDSR
jgi:hypothetical protein